MTEPINIKTKKIIPSKIESLFDKSLVLENLEKNILSHWDTWGKFQQAWTNQAYKTFKDLDKYIVMMYLVRNYWQNLSSKFHYLSMDEFYDLENVTIEKINLIRISSELNIPKETIRRKINFLQTNGIIIRNGKSIFLNSKGLEIQKPMSTIENMSTLLSKLSIHLSAEDWFGKAIEKEDIKKFISEHFTVSWEYWYRFQIPYLVRHRTQFGDLESWNVWGSIGLVQIRDLIASIENEVTNKPKTYADFFLATLRHRSKRGINASSISDISAILDKFLAFFTKNTPFSVGTLSNHLPLISG